LKHGPPAGPEGRGRPLRWPQPAAILLAGCGINGGRLANPYYG